MDICDKHWNFSSLLRSIMSSFLFHSLSVGRLMAKRMANSVCEFLVELFCNSLAHLMESFWWFLLTRVNSVRMCFIRVTWILYNFLREWFTSVWYCLLKSCCDINSSRHDIFVMHIFSRELHHSNCCAIKLIALWVYISCMCACL